ncbi:hypothetical protein C8R45DRAFT_1205605 [Mycena sanguinolenta]|nr:hypothetical protein C8R45DRAFT_1205605 [Mycena sanguinolenta]
MLLVRVCRAWRNIALATPTLWSVFELSLDSTLVRADVMEGIRRWLDRAGQCPLSLILDAHDIQVTDQVNPTAGFIANILRRCSHQVDYLELRTTAEHLRQLGDPFEFPLLRSVKLSCPDYDNGPSVNIFDRAPLLHELHYEDHITARCISLPWLQLTKFEGSISNLHLFTQAPNLAEVTCTLKFFSNPSSSARISHIRLRSLIVKAVHHRGVHALLENLTLPALRHLDVSAESCDTELAALVKRSSPPLLSLSVRATNDDFNWTKCLAPMAKTLENLHIHFPSESLIFSLFPVHDSVLSTDAFPKLQRLSLSGVDPPYRPDLQGLVQFLDSRYPGLRSFRLVWNYSPFMDRRFYTVGDKKYTVSGHLSTWRAGAWISYLP